MNIFDEMAEEGKPPAKNATMKEYRLIYLAGHEGIGKRVEFNAPNVEEAVERASRDAMGRS